MCANDSAKFRVSHKINIYMTIYFFINYLFLEAYTTNIKRPTKMLTLCNKVPNLSKSLLKYTSNKVREQFIVGVIPIKCTLK